MTLCHPSRGDGGWSKDGGGEWTEVVDSGVFKDLVADQMWAVSDMKELGIRCPDFWPGRLADSSAIF